MNWCWLWLSLLFAEKQHDSIGNMNSCRDMGLQGQAHVRFPSSMESHELRYFRFKSADVRDAQRQTMIALHSIIFFIHMSPIIFAWLYMCIGVLEDQRLQISDKHNNNLTNMAVSVSIYSMLQQFSNTSQNNTHEYTIHRINMDIVYSLIRTFSGTGQADADYNCTSLNIMPHMSINEIWKFQLNFDILMRHITLVCRMYAECKLYSHA